MSDFCNRCMSVSDSLRAGRQGDRIPVEASFSAPVQTGPVVHPAYCTMGTGSLSQEKSDRGVASAEVKERVELNSYPPPFCVFMSCSRANFTFFT